VKRLSDGEVEVVYKNQLNGQNVYPAELSEHCQTEGISTYSYACDELVLVESY
jgi:hypothetical protein